MFSDTHFHMRHIANGGTVDLAEVFAGLLEKDCKFLLDIGTEHDDLPKRIEIARTFCAQFPLLKARLHFSAGIWPTLKAIHGRIEQIASLKHNLQENILQAHSVIAIGECGFDHHQTDFNAATDTKIVDAEYELFSMQLELAHNTGLPVIVHSRDAFDATWDCINNSPCRKGIIHCFSYGIEEARKFLDLDFYISLSGAVTYAKKNKIEQITRIENLCRFIPSDKLLLETDSPYLAPVPFRGKTNTPLLVEHVYRFVSAARRITPETLSETVDASIEKLFGINH